MGQKTTCPQCHSRQIYTLADGRRKCRLCLKKFTLKPRRQKLSPALLRELARSFWQGAPAAKAALRLGISTKAAERRYRQLRRGLAQRALLFGRPQLSGEVEVDESCFGGARSGKRGRGAAGKRPVFGLLKRGGAVRVVFPERLDGATLKGAIREHVQPHSWVYSDGFSSCDGLHLEGFHHERIEHSETLGQGRQHINGIENFWGFAKRRLKMCHGGFKGNFEEFLLEMEFRFNHGSDPAAVEILAAILRKSPVGK